MKRWEVIKHRVSEELLRRQAECEDPTLTAITIVVKFDQRTGQPGALLWRTEAERRLAKPD